MRQNERPKRPLLMDKLHQKEAPLVRSAILLLLAEVEIERHTRAPVGMRRSTLVNGPGTMVRGTKRSSAMDALSGRHNKKIGLHWICMIAFFNMAIINSSIVQSRSLLLFSLGDANKGM